VKPQPWSFSRLESFVNCPKQFASISVYKTHADEENEQSLWGHRVHKHFEEFVADGVALPRELEEHEEFLMKLMKLPGVRTTEEKIALGTDQQPCAYFADNVWYRGVIDFKAVAGTQALLIDYKTGKHHKKFKQLKAFALHTFASDPAINTVRAEYYWTKDRTKCGETYTRSQIGELWSEFLPDLRQYRDAFKTELWQPRPSGLCNGWCPVTDCEFWKPKRRKG
jgi:hypothetical protein